MFYKICNKCTNKTCKITKIVCPSMEGWLKKYVEGSQKEKLMNRHELGLYNFFTQSNDTKEDV